MGSQSIWGDVPSYTLEGASPFLLKKTGDKAVNLKAFMIQ
jgi:hypothetical protein